MSARGRAVGVLATAVGVVVFVVAAWVDSPPARAAATSEQGVIVELAPGADQAAAVGAAKAYGSRIGSRYHHIFNGFEATVTSAELARLRHDRLVRAVVPDITLHAADTEVPVPSWGLDRIDQRLLPLDNSFTYPSTGQGVTAYVVDTGVSPIADLGPRLLPGVDEVPDSSCDPASAGTTDFAGHGTFVADEIAGSLYGVAKGVSVVPVKVLDCQSSGTLSSVLAGLDWIAQNTTGPSVVNMSLAVGSSPVLDQAVDALVGQGITVVVAAGNLGLDACTISPAEASGAIAVGATDITDTYPYFSDRGSCVALSAPGVDISADFNNGVPGTDSGTSMASPEVAGVAALQLAANPGLTPAQVRACLQGEATPGQIQGLNLDTPNLLLDVPRNLACHTITGTKTGPLTVGPGVTLINNATVSGPMTIGAGAVVAITGSRVTGAVTATGADLLTACGSTLQGPVNVSGDTGPVTVGALDASCAPDTITGPLTVSSDAGGVTVARDTITAALTLTGDSGGVIVYSNTLAAPFSLTGTTPGTEGRPTVVAANTTTATLACSQNNPAPTDNGQVNTGKGTGQCQAITVK